MINVIMEAEGFYTPEFQVANNDSRIVQAQTSGAVFKALGFSHYLPEKLIDIYTGLGGGELHLSNRETIDTNPYPVSIFQGKNKDKNRSEAAAFLKEYNSLEKGSSKSVKFSVSGKAATQGTLGQFTIIFDGILKRNKDDSWEFSGTMQFMDVWDFDKKEGGQRTSGSERATQIGRDYLVGQTFEIFSPLIPVKQTSEDSQVDWWNDKNIKEIKSSGAEFLKILDEEF